MKLVDVHLHLTSFITPSSDGRYSIDPSIITAAKSQNVSAMICMSENTQDWSKVDWIASQYPGYVYRALGLHPETVVTLSDSELDEQLERLRSKYEIEFQVRGTKPAEASSNQPVVCVGEIGLDYSPHVLAAAVELEKSRGEQEPSKLTEEAMKQRQIKAFKYQINLAKEYNLPVSVHSRSAGRYAIQVLEDQHATHVCLHAFDGKPSYAVSAATKNGYYFSLPPSVVHSEGKQRLAKAMPLDKLLLETDSPALAPVRGEQNVPSNLHKSLQMLAGIKSMSEEEVANIIYKNTRELFPFLPQLKE